jgi:2-alkyl-3-oxoalkanoate reductase
MKILITGASGFLGQYVVAQALRQGYQVAAVVRPQTKAASLPWHEHPNLDLVRLDLRQSRGIVEALTGIDAVIHLAAAKAGDFYAQFAGTVIATENLLTAMPQANVTRLIAISTFSVYDYLKLRSGQWLDETSPIEAKPKNRDEYAQTKLLQEALYRSFSEAPSHEVTILRPGMIYGRNNLWHALIGAELGKTRWLKVGGRGILPLTYVENCAEAIVQAIAATAAIGETINLVDDNLPTQHCYTEKILAVTPEPPKLTSISWWGMQSIANTAWWVNQQFLGGQGRLPGILVPAKIHARFKPLRYRNSKAKQLLDWHPRYSLDQAIARSTSTDNLLKVSANPKLDTFTTSSETFPETSLSSLEVLV